MGGCVASLRRDARTTTRRRRTIFEGASERARDSFNPARSTVSAATPFIWQLRKERRDFGGGLSDVVAGNPFICPVGRLREARAIVAFHAIVLNLSRMPKIFRGKAAIVNFPMKTSPQRRRKTPRAECVRSSERVQRSVGGSGVNKFSHSAAAATSVEEK